jgi:hypothetical protein
MATPTRIYRWQDRLIRASHPSHVIAHVAEQMDKPRVATTDDVEALLTKGVRVESVKGEQAELIAGSND